MRAKETVCQHCGKRYDAWLGLCPFCGVEAPKDAEKTGRKPVRLIIIGLLSLAIFCGAVFGIYRLVSGGPHTAKPSATDRDTIKDGLFGTSDNASKDTGGADDASETLRNPLLTGVWYEYSFQDVFAYEWLFYDNGTCTREMRAEGGARKYDVEPATYTVHGNSIVIEIENRRSHWEYDPDEDCCFLYFGDEFGEYKFKIPHYAEKLPKNVLDETFYHVSDYIIKTAENQRFGAVTDPIELVKKWDEYNNLGFCCDYVDAPPEIYDHLTFKQQQYVVWVLESTCCNSMIEASAHIAHYMDASLVSNQSDAFLEYNGKLYIVVGGMGSITHDYETYTVESTANSTDSILYATRITVDVDGVDKFVVEQVNNTLKIKQIVKVK